MPLSLLVLSTLLTLFLSRPPPADAATLLWDDNSSGTGQEANFVIESSTNSGGPWTDIFHPVQNATSYQFTTPAPGTTFYRIKAVNTAGNSPWSNVVSLVVPTGGGGSPPGVPTITSCVFDGSTPPPPPPSGLVLAMNLNATTGTVAADSGGSNNNGTLTNGPVWVTGGKYSGGLSFDGSNDFVSIPDAATLDLTSTGTIMAWVKFDVVNRWNAMIAKGNVNTGQGHNYWLEVSDTNLAHCGIGNGTTYQDTTAAINAAGVWQHLACTWDSTTLKVFKNGVQVASASRTVAAAGNTSPLYLGQVGGNADRMDGTLDDVRIYSTAKTASEITTDMNTFIP